MDESRQTPTSTADAGGRWRRVDPLLLGVLFVLIVVAWFPGVLAGRAISVADKLYVHPPWQAAKPAGYLWPANKMLFDQVNQVYPWADYARTRLRRGEWPLWNPYPACGTSFFANQNAGLLSPFHLPLWLATDTATGLTLVALLKILVAAAGAQTLTRALGVSPVGALSSAAVYALGGPMAVWLGHPLTTASPLLPWSLLAAERLVSAGGRRGGGRFSAAAVTGVTAAHLLGSHPETSLHIVLLTAVYGSIRACQCHRRAAPSRVGLLAVAMVLGLLIAAVQVVPFVDALYRSYPRAMRLASPGHAVGIPATALPLAVAPRLYGSPMDVNHREDLVSGRNFAESTPFAGLLPLLLLPLAWRRTRGRDAARLLLLLGAAGLAVALDPLGLPSALLRRLPLIGLGAHHRLILMWVLAVAVGVGIAIDGLGESGSRGTRAHWPMVAGSGLLLGWGTVRVIAAGAWYDRLAPQLALATALLFAAVAVVAAVSRPTARRPRGGPAALIVLGLILVDLWAFGHDINPTLDRRLIFPPTPTTDFLRAATRGGRILAIDGALPANSGLPYGLSDVRGYEPLMSEDYQRFWFETMTPNGAWTPVFWKDMRAPALLPLFGVEFVVAGVAAPAPAPELARVHDGDASLFRVDAPLDRVFARFVWDRETTATGAGRRLRDGYPYRERVLLDAPPTPDQPAAAEPPTARVAANRRSPERLEIDADLTAPGVIVFMESFDPGWQVTVDGGVAPLLRAYGAFQAVAVEAGRHAVVFRYVPRGLELGLALSGLGLVGLVGLVWSARSQPGGAGA